MDKQLIALARVASELNGEDLRSLEARLRLQKKIYLLKLVGLDLGYVFGWDLYGPYSKELADDVARYQADDAGIREVAADLQLTAAAKKKIDQVKNLMAVPETAAIAETLWLELLASMHYLAQFFLATNARLRQAIEVGDLDELAEEVRKLLPQRKPHLKDHLTAFESAWNRLLPFFH